MLVYSSNTTYYILLQEMKLCTAVFMSSNCIQCCKLGKLFMGKDGEMLEYAG